MQIPFGEWLPDQPEHGKQGANVANNVYYAANTYKRFPSLVVIVQIQQVQILKVQVLLEITLIQFITL